MVWPPQLPLGYVFVCAVIVWVLIQLSRLCYKTIRIKQLLPLPPGPPRMPFVGNLLDMPEVKPWLKYREWCQKYGRCPIRADSESIC